MYPTRVHDDACGARNASFCATKLLAFASRPLRHIMSALALLRPLFYFTSSSERSGRPELAAREAERLTTYYIKKKKKKKRGRGEVDSSGWAGPQSLLTLLGPPESRFEDKLLIIRVLCPHIGECGAEGDKLVRRCLNRLRASSRAKVSSSVFLSLQRTCGRWNSYSTNTTNTTNTARRSPLALAPST